MQGGAVVRDRVVSWDCKRVHLTKKVSVVDDWTLSGNGKFTPRTEKGVFLRSGIFDRFLKSYIRDV